MAWVGTVSSQMDWEWLPVAPLYMLTSELTVHILKNPAKGADHSTLEAGRGVGDFAKTFPASACRKKKIACSTNVIESLWEKREKNILRTRLLEKKFLMTRNHPPPPPHQELNGRPLNRDDNENDFKTNRSNKQKTNCTCSTLFLLISKNKFARAARFLSFTCRCFERLQRLQNHKTKNWQKSCLLFSTTCRGDFTSKPMNFPEIDRVIFRQYRQAL